MGAGVVFDEKTNIPRKGIEATQVKSIKLISVLDDGSLNDGSKTIKEKSGLVYGKTYTFKVETYTNDAPKDPSMIRWAVSYTDTETGKFYKNALEGPNTGEEISITFNDANGCGNNLEIKAYINDVDNEGKLTLFKHNRFRFFDRKTLKSEIQQRMNTGKDIDQGQSSMCAIALIGHFLAIQKPSDYEKIILDMHRTGEAIVPSTQYKIKLDKDEHLIKVKDSDASYPNNSNGGKMSYADFIFLFTIKDYLNSVFDYDPDGTSAGGFVEGGTGLTLPHEVASMMKNILSYTDVKNETNLVTSKWASAKNSANELSGLLTSGYSIGLLITAGNFQNNSKGTFTIPNHWVGLKGVTLDEKNEKVILTLFTWGDISKVWTVSFDPFEDGYFGYVAGK
ncbi:hypothetical protein AAEU33_02370 [Chryseobacterium sp. Chry.R1]|uniref:hypothetical protein n=1 Tax=Chryseobacterium sp. Chry.R1 TaxID=3139392 RepID=UPI0031F9B683